MIMIPTELDESTIKEATDEVNIILQSAILRGMPSIDKIPDENKPIGKTNSVVVIPINTQQDSYPLCVKFGRVSSNDNYLWSYGSIGKDISTYIQNIDDNWKALIQIGLPDMGIIVPPQKIIGVGGPSEALYKDTTYNEFNIYALLVPDFSNKQKEEVMDLAEFEHKNKGIGEFSDVYEKIYEKMEKVDFKASDRHNTLEKLVKHMLFVVPSFLVEQPNEQSEEYRLLVGDINHFVINYALCSCCNKETYMLKIR